MSVRSRLNGYTVPTAVVAVVLTFVLAWSATSCSRLGALEAAEAAELAWRQGHQDIADQRIRQIDALQTKVDQMHGILEVLKDRSDRLERERIRGEQGQ
jgi:hypothetical protein